MPAMVCPSPARAPEKDAEGLHRKEEEQHKEKCPKTPYAEAKWAVEWCPPPIIGIRDGCSFPGGGFNCDRRSLCNTGLESDVRDACNGSDEHQPREDP